MAAPLITVNATDPQARYMSGSVGLVVASQSSPTIGVGASFSDFHVDADIPLLSLSGESAGATAVLSWPAQLSSIWVLESSSSLEAGASWSEVAAKNVTYADGQKVHQQAAPIGESGNSFFRLRKL